MGEKSKVSIRNIRREANDDLKVKLKEKKISEDEKLRKKIGKKGKSKYMKYFNSTLVADFIINKTYEMNGSKRYLWHKP